MKSLKKEISDSINEVTVVFALKNNYKIDVAKYPLLKELGSWVNTKDQTNLYLRTKLDKPTLVKKFSEITGLSNEQFDTGAVSSINSVW
ncbi:hypothetical protein [Xylocopilactobacillus apis]|uniref:Uncharacterized protein n=1 Tax=Xylocopilactobacillus apis TaxID=2932183 RepID=A0AAU9D1K6_9LACO|nr:hypothetical protein [Xylocopilactobacillus apis]BDR56366.1 hypothetical protein KIMC2_09280 [Xylocopilactobacillus apis]